MTTNNWFHISNASEIDSPALLVYAAIAWFIESKGMIAKANKFLPQ